MSTKRAFFIVGLMAAAFDLVAALASAQIHSGHPDYMPASHRHENWSVQVGGEWHGSCMYACASAALESIDAPKLAGWIRRNEGGGQTAWHLNRDLKRLGIETLLTEDGDKRVLDFAHVKGLPAVISYKRGHACLFKGWITDSTGRITHAKVWDSNYPDQLERPTYTRFMSRWYGEAVVFIPRRRP